MKQITSVILLLASVQLFAQAGNDNISYSSGNFFMRTNRPSNTEHNIDGTPYINGKEYRKVTIGGYSKNVQDLRYNAYDDEMEFSQNGENYYANKEEGLKVEMPALNKTYQVVKYMYNDRSYFGYLVVLSLGTKYKLYKKEKVELLKGEKSPSAYGKDANDYFAKAKDVYLVGREGSNNLEKSPKNAKEASAFFSSTKDDINQFLKQNKINFNKEEDLIKLVNFANQ